MLGKSYRAHRLAFLYMLGRLPDGEVDHINHIKDDNRWENLRDVTKQDNCKNLGLSKANTSGVTGVHFFKRDKKWRASITVDGKIINLGHYDGFDEACKVRKRAEIEHNYHSNHGAV